MEVIDKSTIVVIVGKFVLNVRIYQAMLVFFERVTNFLLEKYQTSDYLPPTINLLEDIQLWVEYYFAILAEFEFVNTGKIQRKYQYLKNHSFIHSRVLKTFEELGQANPNVFVSCSYDGFLRPLTTNNNRVFKQVTTVFMKDQNKTVNNPCCLPFNRLYIY